MAAFGGDSPKPLMLRGDAAMLKKMHEVAKSRASKSSAPRRLVVRKGNVVTGVKKALEQSSGYTAMFGAAISHCYLDAGSSEIMAALRALEP